MGIIKWNPFYLQNAHLTKIAAKNVGEVAVLRCLVLSLTHFEKKWETESFGRYQGIAKCQKFESYKIKAPVNIFVRIQSQF